MDRLVLFISFLFVLSSCNPDEDRMLRNNPCSILKQLHAPEDYTLERLDSLPFEYGIETFQFLDEMTGFVLVDFNTADSTGILKTNNGAISWDELPSDIPHNPNDLEFVNEDLGYISVYAPVETVMYISSNGGQGWERREYPELNGQFGELVAKDTTIYAELIENAHSVLMRSDDQGVSWDTVYSEDNFDPRYAPFSFTVRDDRLYLAGDNGRIITTDPEGNTQQIQETGLLGLIDLEIIDGQHWIATSVQAVVSSSNGGASWTQIHDNNARVIDFTTPEEGLIVLQDSVCYDYDIGYSYDAIAVTSNGGSEWNWEGYTTGLTSAFDGAEKIPGGDYIIAFRGSFYRLQKD